MPRSLKLGDKARNCERVTIGSLKQKNTSEAKTVTAICHYLEAKKYFFWRQSNTGVYRVDRNAYIPSPNSMRGIPDIFLIRSNGFGSVIYGIEVKSATGQQSEFQKKFQQKLEASGGIYILARSVDDLIEGGL